MPRSQELSQQPQLRFKVFLLPSGYCYGPQSYSIITKPIENKSNILSCNCKNAEGTFLRFPTPRTNSKRFKYPEYIQKPIQEIPQKNPKRPKWVIFGVFGYFGGTENGTSGALIKILRPLFNTNTPPKPPFRHLGNHFGPPKSDFQPFCTFC